MADTQEKTYECCGGGPADGEKMAGGGHQNAIMLRLNKRTGEQHYYRLVTNPGVPDRPETYYQYEGTDPNALMARMLEENPHVFDEE
jgi:hypothetical protein